jgi:hypothetical protein
VYAFDLDYQQPLAKGTYDVYVWLEKRNATTSYTASTPQYFHIEVGELTPLVLSNGAAIRHSNSEATVKFTSNKDGGGYRYLILPATAAAPDASEIYATGGYASPLYSGENIIDLTSLNPGQYTIYIVGFGYAGMYTSNILSVTIPAYTTTTPIITGGYWGLFYLISPPVSFPAFIQGFEDNTFRGDSSITREQFVAILFRLNAPTPRPLADRNNPSFKDVAPSRWSYDAIEWAKQKGIISADNQGNFRPAQALTRADMAVMFVKTDGLTAMAANTFSDIANHKDKDDILKAVQAKIFTGYPDGTFRPNGYTTRSEAVTALVRYLLEGDPDNGMWQNKHIAFGDVSYTYWAYKYIVLGVNGYSGFGL